MQELEAGSAGLGQEPQFDQNGEEILYEAKCDKRQVLCNSLSIALLAVTIGAVGMGTIILVAIPGTFIMYFAITKNWKLYLTKRGIHHVRPGGFCGCCTSHWFISLEEIQEVSCNGTTISVKVSPEKVSTFAVYTLHSIKVAAKLMIRYIKKFYIQAKELIHWCSRPLTSLCFELNTLLISYAKNPQEFVDAVNQAKAGSV